MAATITPAFTDNVSVAAITTLARNATARATLDLRTKWGAWVHVLTGRGGTTALSAGIDILARRTQSNGGIITPAAVPQMRTDTTAAQSTTCTASGSPNNAGVTSLTVASTTSFAAGDLILVQDNASPTSVSEWLRVARVTSSTVLLLDTPTQQAHNNTAHTVRNKAEAYAFWLDGGALWEIIIDYGAQSTGDTLTYLILAQTLDSISSV